MSEDLIRNIFKKQSPNIPEIPAHSQYYLNRYTGSQECPPDFKTLTFGKGFNICHKPKNNVINTPTQNGVNLHLKKTKYQRIAENQTISKTVYHSRTLYGDKELPFRNNHQVATNYYVIDNLTPYFDGTGFLQTNEIQNDRFGTLKSINTIVAPESYKNAPFDASRMTQKRDIQFLQL